MSKKSSNVSKNRRRLLKLSKPELVKECKKHKLSIYGNKSKLVKRLTTHINDNCHCNLSRRSSIALTNFSPNSQYIFKSNYNRCNKSKHDQMPTLQLSLTSSATFEAADISKSPLCKSDHINTSQELQIKDIDNEKHLKLSDTSIQSLKPKKGGKNRNKSKYKHKKSKTFTPIPEPIDFEAYFAGLFCDNMYHVSK